VPCQYGVNGDLYTEMTFEWPTGRQVPATYYWSFDGKNLNFQLWGEDLRPHRKEVYDGETYIKAETDTPSPTRTPLPSVETTEFPTGRFVRDDGYWALEFDEDGTWRGGYGDAAVSIISGKCATNGNLWTEMTHDYPTSPKIPATYTWTYDGQKLTFHLWGEDVNAHRRSCLDGQTYTKVE
jgi:hypothetical protein